MDCIKNESAAGRENLKTFFDMVFHLLRCRIVQDMPCVTAAAPEGDIITEFLFQCHRVHIHTIRLDRVQDIIASLDHIRQQRVDGAT